MKGTKIIIDFDIHYPELLSIDVDNRYMGGLSMADVVKNREQLHKTMDKVLDEISSQLFVQKTNERCECGRIK